jgi:hypothetical protein
MRAGRRFTAKFLKGRKTHADKGGDSATLILSLRRAGGLQSHRAAQRPGR